MANRDEVIEEVVKEFDFGKVHKALVAVEWKWSMGEEPMGVPTRDQIEKEARDLLKRAWDSKREWRTGGFVAYYVEEGDGELPCLGLYFRLEIAEADVQP
jgi:hypothetical protein